MRDCILLAACGAHETLPQNSELPVDVFTSCLTTPIKIALRWFCPRSLLCLDPAIVDKIPGKQNDRKKLLGELNLIFTAITGSSRGKLFRNFLLAERIMGDANCCPQSYPRLPSTYQHFMWDAWDMAAEVCFEQLPILLSDPATEFQVLLDPAVPKNVLLDRAKALKKLGQIFQGSKVAAQVSEMGSQSDTPKTPKSPPVYHAENRRSTPTSHARALSHQNSFVGTFSMRVRREIGKATPAPKPVAPGLPVLCQAMVEYKPADAALSVPSKSAKLAKTAPSSAAVEGGLLFVTSPKSLKYLAS